MGAVETEVATRRERGGRAARHARRSQSGTIGRIARLTRKVPLYDLLDEESLDALEAHADWILQEIGIEIRGDPEALALFKAAGAEVQGERLRFEPGLLRKLCATAPKAFTFHARDPKNSLTIGKDHVVFSPAYGPPFVSDLEGGRRYATIQDFRNFVKLTYLSPWLQHGGGTLCEPVDLPVNKRHLDMVYAHLRYSTKAFMGAVTAPARAEDSLAMARIAFGAETLERHCVIQGNINVNSPLVFDDTMTGALKVYARAGQAVLLSPFILGGAMGPVTQPALIAQAHAEALVGIALTQLVRPGAPVVYGCFLTTLNLKTGAPTFGTPEANLAILAVGQLCRRLGLPLRCGGHLTAAKVADGQAMQESADSMNSGLLAGANLVIQSAGWLEGGLTMGYEKFVIDAERCGEMHRALSGLTIDRESLAEAAFREAGPGETFLGTQHTLANFEAACPSSRLADDQSYEAWLEQGGKTQEERAHCLWQRQLAAYEPPAIDPAVDEALKDFMARKKRAVEDAWY